MDDQRKAEIRALGEKIKAAWMEQHRLYAIMDSDVATAEDRVQAAIDHKILVKTLGDAIANMNGAGRADDPNDRCHCAQGNQQR